MKMNQQEYYNKLKGAIIGRFAGCALGAPVEMMELGKLIQFAKEINQDFPPTDYFLQAPNPDAPRYKVGKGRHFTKPEMKFLSTDDDITYTILSLMMLEAKGEDLTTDDVANFWLEYLPIECTYTAERTTLQNLKNNMIAEEAGVFNNTELDYIGAAIRIDGYGYIHPGNPEKAVRLPNIDASLSHRDVGVDSALYFAALISLAFTSNDITKSMYQALEFIPKTGLIYQEITWALSVKDQVTNYLIANQLVTKRYPNMSWAHAINNACLTVWGIYLGQHDYTKAISETVAMGYDNDCTAATVGSVLGAYLGIDAIDQKWYQPWNNKLLSYLHNIDSFELDDIINRFYQIGLKNVLGDSV